MARYIDTTCSNGMENLVIDTEDGIVSYTILNGPTYYTEYMTDAGGDLLVWSCPNPECIDEDDEPYADSYDLTQHVDDEEEVDEDDD